MSSLAESVVGATDDLFGGTPAMETPPAEPEAPEPGEEPLDLAPAADLTDLFGDDDFEIDDEPDTSAFDELSEDELRAELVKEKRKTQHERQLRVQTGIKAWRVEANTKFPYSKPETITAESRRDFLRQAQARDAQVREVAEPIVNKYKAREAQMRVQIEAEVRAEYEKGWGPVTVNGSPGAPAADLDKRLERSRKKRDLFGVTKAMMEGGQF